MSLVLALMHGIAFAAFAWLAFYLPGRAIVRTAVPGARDPFERTTIAWLIGWWVVSMLAFQPMTLMVRVPPNQGYVGLGLAALVVAVIVAAAFRGRRRHAVAIWLIGSTLVFQAGSIQAALPFLPVDALIPVLCTLAVAWLVVRRAGRLPVQTPDADPDDAVARRWRRAAGLGALAVLTLGLVTRSLHDFNMGCAYGVVARAIGVPLGETDGPGSGFPSIFIDTHTRYGFPALVSTVAAGMRFFGVRLVNAVVPAALAAVAFMLVRRETRNGWVALAVAATVPFTTRLVPTIGENPTALLIGMTFLFLAFHGRASGLVLGMVFGALWAVLHVFVIMLPVALLAVPRERWRGFAGGFALIAAGFVMHHWIAFGSPLADEHASYISRWPYEFAGMAFELPVHLNWPIHDHLVRSPYNPFPNALIVPLHLLGGLGWIACAVAIAGWVELACRDRRRAVVVAGWFLPLVAFVVLMENWSERAKWDLVLAGLAGWPLCLGLGLDAFVRGTGVARLRASGVSLASVAVFAGIRAFAVSVDAPMDARSFDEPAYNEQSLGLMATEDPRHLAAERERLLAPRWLPHMSVAGESMSSVEALAMGLGDLARPGFSARTPSLSEGIIEALVPDIYRAHLIQRELPLAGSKLAPGAADPQARTLIVDLRVHPSDRVALVRIPETPAEAADLPSVTLEPSAAFAVDWTPDAVAVRAIRLDAEKTLVLLVQRDRTGTPLAPAGPLRFALPAGYRLLVNDVLAFDPSVFAAFEMWWVDGKLVEGKL